MSRKSILRGEWECDRCGNIAESNQVVVADSVGAVVDVNLEEAIREVVLPRGWARLTMDWGIGTRLLQDLCTLCAEEIDGVCTRTFTVVRPGEVTEAEDKPAAKKTTKRAAKKASPKQQDSDTVPEED